MARAEADRCVRRSAAIRLLPLMLLPCVVRAMTAVCVQVIAVAKSVDLVLMVLDAGKEMQKNHRAILERELRTAGLRINQEPPDIYFMCDATRRASCV